MNDEDNGDDKADEAEVEGDKGTNKLFIIIFFHLNGNI